MFSDTEIIKVIFKFLRMWVGQKLVGNKNHFEIIIEVEWKQQGGMGKEGVKQIIGLFDSESTEQKKACIEVHALGVADPSEIVYDVFQ